MSAPACRLRADTNDRVCPGYMSVQVNGPSSAASPVVYKQAAHTKRLRGSVPATGTCHLPISDPAHQIPSVSRTSCVIAGAHSHDSKPRQPVVPPTKATKIRSVRHRRWRVRPVAPRREWQSGPGSDNGPLSLLPAVAFHAARATPVRTSTGMSVRAQAEKRT